MEECHEVCDLGDCERAGVEVVAVPCPFGGSRRWVVCPGCGRRRLRLYLLRDRLWCRACHGLTYASRRRPRRPKGE